MTEPVLDRQCRGHHDTITAIDFSPTGKQIASSSLDATVMIWNQSQASGSSDSSQRSKSGSSITSDSAVSQNRQRCYKYEGHKDAVYNLQFSHNGQLLATCSRDRTIRLWIPNVKAEHTSWQAHTGAVRSISFSPDGNNLLSGSDDKTIKLWSTHKQKFITSFRGHQNWVRSCKFDPMNPNGIIVSGSDDKTVKLWDQRQHSCIHTFHEHGGYVNQVAFHPSGTCVASAGSDAAVRIWDIRTLQLGQYYPIHGTAVNSIDFHPNGQWLLTAGSDGTCSLLDVLEGRRVFTLHGHEGAATACKFSRTGHKIASGSVDEAVTIWSSNLEQFAVDAAEKRQDEKLKKREETKKAKELQRTQKENVSRLSVPVSRKVPPVKTAKGTIVTIKKPHAKPLTAKSDKQKIQKPKSKVKITEPQSRTLTDGTLAAENAVLKATVDTLETRLAIVENRLQECMLELHVTKATNTDNFDQLVNDFDKLKHQKRHSNSDSNVSSSRSVVSGPPPPLPETLKPTHSTIKVLNSLSSDQDNNSNQNSIILEQENDETLENFCSDSSNTFFEEPTGRLTEQPIAEEPEAEFKEFRNHRRHRADGKEASPIILNPGRSSQYLNTQQALTNESTKVAIPAPQAYDRANRRQPSSHHHPASTSKAKALAHEVNLLTTKSISTTTDDHNDRSDRNNHVGISKDFDEEPTPAPRLDHPNKVSKKATHVNDMAVATSNILDKSEEVIDEEEENSETPRNSEPAGHGATNQRQESSSSATAIRVSQIYCSAGNSRRASSESVNTCNQALPNSMRNSANEIKRGEHHQNTNINSNVAVVEALDEQLAAALVNSRPNSRMEPALKSPSELVTDQIAMIASDTVQLLREQTSSDIKLDPIQTQIQHQHHQIDQINREPAHVQADLIRAQTLDDVDVDAEEIRNSANISRNSGTSGSHNSIGSNNSSEPHTFQEEILNAEEVRQTALRSLADLRRSLINAVANSVASSENTLLESASRGSEPIE